MTATSQLARSLARHPRLRGVPPLLVAAQAGELVRQFQLAGCTPEPWLADALVERAVSTAEELAIHAQVERLLKEVSV